MRTTDERTEQDAGSPYEPIGVEARYPPPRAAIHPDRSKGWVKRLWPIIWAYRRVIIAGTVCALTMAVVQASVPRVVGEAIDTALPLEPGLEPERALSTFIWLLGGLAVARFVFTAGYRYYLEKTARLVEYDLRTILFQHFNKLSFSFFDRVQSGQLISRANSDVRTVERFFTFAPMMAMAVISFFLALGFMLRMHVWLTLVALIPLPFVYLTGRAMRSRMFPISWLIQQRRADVATVVEENVAGVQIVKSCAAEPHEVNRLARAAQKLRWAQVKQVDLRAVFAPIMENLPRVGLLLILFYGGWLAIDGQIGIGVIVAFSQYVLMLQAPFRILGMLIMMQQRARASAERIFEIVDETPEIQDHPGAVDLLSPRGEVAFEDITFRYRTDDPPILDGFSLTLRPGQTVALVGRTGCGKSTVTRLIPRFYDVEAGRLTVDGHDVRTLTLASLRHHIGLVTEDPFLFSDTIRENITFGRPGASDEEMLRVARIAGVDEFVSELPNGYETVIGERGYTLSGGQRQRVAIARTLLADPKILILDDATSAIDVQLEQQIHEALRELMSERTTFIVAHRLSTISLADRVVLMDSGRVLAEGTHEELLRTVPLYAEVLARVEQEWAQTHTIPDGEAEAVPAPDRFRELFRVRDDLGPDAPGFRGEGF